MLKFKVIDVFNRLIQLKIREGVWFDQL